MYYYSNKKTISTTWFSVDNKNQAEYFDLVFLKLKESSVRSTRSSKQNTDKIEFNIENLLELGKMKKRSLGMVSI